MLIDIVVAWMCGAMLDPFLGGKGYGTFVILGLIILFFVGWLIGVIRLAKNKVKTGMWVVLLIGLLISFLVGWITSWFFGSDNIEIEEKKFHCGICYINYNSELLGGELAREGKICRFCLEKKQRGEKISTDSPPPEEHQSGFRDRFSSPFEPQSRFHHKKESGEKKYLLRQLRREQRAKGSYLTQFIINLFVLQWLLPLITIVISYFDMKSQIKSQFLANNPGGTPPEIPFSKFLKNVGKMLTSDNVDFRGFKIHISMGYKIGIVIAFLLPLCLWIYSLVKWLGKKNEVDSLETELKGLD